MTYFLGLRGRAWLGFVLVAALVTGCPSKDSGSGTTGKGGLPPGKGYCEDTCSKDCKVDNDCDSSRGELCCDLGAAGKTCASASACPRICKDDSTCDTAAGEVCSTVSLNGGDKFCTVPERGIQVCKGAEDCSDSEVCCDIYTKSVCLPPGACPKACKASDECDSANSEICCTTAKAASPNLKADGLCLNPEFEPCPKACTTSTDCSGSAGQVCCDGLCQTSCVKTCSDSSECRDQICCKSAWVRASAASETRLFSASPYCEGEAFGACSDSDCQFVPGCTPVGAVGACLDFGFASSCSDAFNQSECSSLPGCTYSGTAACTGTPSSCDFFSTQSLCDQQPGCSFDAGGSCAELETFACEDEVTQAYCEGLGCTWDGVDETCSGTPTDCADFSTSTTCDQSDNCTWEDASACTGTPTPCGAATTNTACNARLFCTWDESGSCTGTLQSCAVFTSEATCSASSGNCEWSTDVTTCTGTPTPCNALSIGECESQIGCFLVTD